MSIHNSPGQRTAFTAKFLLVVGAMCVVEAVVRDSLARGLISVAMLTGGGLLLSFARRAD